MPTAMETEEATSSMVYSPDVAYRSAPAEPTSQILVTNMDPAIFCNQDLMDAFEGLIRTYDAQCQIFYFKSFLRARIDLDSVKTASSAKRCLHGLPFGSRFLQCYFFRDLLLGRRNSDHLELPPLEKQFLISPPASPPVGWEPVHEGEPIIDYNLVAALAALQPGEVHELHPGAHDKNIPAIVLQPCVSRECFTTTTSEEEAVMMMTTESSMMMMSDDDMSASRKVPRPQIVQTRRPPEREEGD
ncbi:putative Calcipressin-2 [Hypsibius exemplaris]|uniref:Calcipressin-2 n=1 Tax=Hypsibius exemplaris TaxID=2072580 RepID=A0A1W0X7M0_HYPEX|nr:putative Calcipressin-2 [Hypsibius exemplaris]